MSKITVRSRVGADGVLHLDIPTSMKDAEVEVTITLTPISNPIQQSPEELRRTEEFIERTFGRWQGDPPERPDQGEYEKRDWHLM